MLGENFESFEQWKSLVLLLCGCREALLSRRDLYFRAIPVLYTQIEQLPDEFFAENESGADASGFCGAPHDNNFISKAMNDLIRTSLEQPGVSKHICRRVEKLQGLLTSKFGFKKVLTEEERVIKKASLKAVDADDDSEYDDEMP